MNPSLIQIKTLDPKAMPPKGASVFSWIWYFFVPYKNILAPYLVYRIFRYTTFALLPAFLGFYLDGYVTNKIATEAFFYNSLAIVYLSIYSILACNLGIFKLESTAAENASRSLALLGMKMLNTLPVSWHIDQASGRKIDIVNEGRRGLFELSILFRWQMIPVVGNIIGTCVMVMIFSGPRHYAVSMILFAFLYLFSAWHFGKPLVQCFKNYRETYSKLLSRFYEFSSSALTVKSLSLEPYLESQGMSLENSARDSAIFIYAANYSKWTKVNLTTVVFLLFFTISGFRDLSINVLTPGAFSSLLMLFIYMWNSLEGLSVAQDRIYDYLSGLKRFVSLCEIAREESEKEEDQNFKNVPFMWDKLEVRSLSFSYNSEAKDALSNLTFSIERTKRLAVVGPSGAGKSTLIKLLLRLYRPEEGEISLDGENISAFTHADWLKYLSYVPQDIDLFDGNIRENILLGRMDVDEAKYDQVLKNSGVLNFIEGLPERDLTIVGERGLKLSGGQRQRIGIARALIREAKILLLDEATSALDSITERQIQDILFTELKDVTLIIIAHRLSTIKRADRILVLDEGRLVEEGTFADLRDKGGKFTEMWESARI